jgi:hypothetical protein
VAAPSEEWFSLRGEQVKLPGSSWGIDPATASGDYCGSLQSFYATGLLQIWVAVGAPDIGDGRWRRSPMSTVAKDLLVIFVFSRGFRAYSLGQLSVFHVLLSYLYVYAYVFLI